MHPASAMRIISMMKDLKRKTASTMIMKRADRKSPLRSKAIYGKENTLEAVRWLR